MKRRCYVLLIVAAATAFVFVVFLILPNGLAWLQDIWDEHQFLAEYGPIDPEPEKPGSPFRIDGNSVVRRELDGRSVWSTALTGPLDGVRDPHLLSDAERVYVSDGDGITTLDAETGGVVWHRVGPNDRLCLSGGLLLATDCTSSDYVGPDGRLVVARRLEDGVEKWRRVIPRHFDPSPIREVAGLLLVQTHGMGKEPTALLLDHKGNGRFQFNTEVLDVLPCDGDWIFLTGDEVTRGTAGGTISWTIPFPGHDFVGGGALVPLPGGDCLAYGHCGIADRGVDLVRFDPGQGQERWRAYCARLGVTHSAYEHNVRIRVDGDQVAVLSDGSGGKFVERIDLQSGKQLLRRERAPWKGRPPGASVFSP